MFRPLRYKLAGAIFGLVLLCLTLPGLAKADIAGDSRNFYLESSYDLTGREQATAVLRYVSDNAYFYIEHSWYNSLSGEQKALLEQILPVLGQEFDANIYPKITATFGSCLLYTSPSPRD